MELTLKQKVAVFAVMLAIFMSSVFIKQWIDGKGDSENSVSPTNQIQSEESLQNKASEDLQQTEKDVKKEIIIDVEGAVTYPGVVKLQEGSRVYEAVDKAGGLLDNADTKYVNLAEELTDGSIIYIPEKGENSAEEGALPSGGNQTSLPQSSKSELININSADKTELMKLPGIGEAYAQAIIDYRESKGNFSKIEDIKEVSGIGDAKYEKMKDLICVY